EGPGGPAWQRGPAGPAGPIGPAAPWPPPAPPAPVAPSAPSAPFAPGGPGGPAMPLTCTGLWAIGSPASPTLCPEPSTLDACAYAWSSSAPHSVPLTVIVSVAGSFSDWICQPSAGE